MLKINGGAIGFFDNKDALLKWTVSGPIIWEMLRDINSKLGDVREGIFQLHHEDTDVLKSIGNSFLETESCLIHITTKHAWW